MIFAEDDPRHGSHNAYSQGCRCEPCRLAEREYQVKYRAANSARLKEKNRLRYAQNSEEIRARQAAYRAANPEKAKMVWVRWYAMNAEKAIAKSTAYQKAHPEKKRAWQAKYQAKNPEVHRANEQTRRDRKRERWIERVDRALVWERGEGTCHICKETADSGNWELDHIVPLALGGEHSYANSAVSHPVCNRNKGARLA